LLQKIVTDKRKNIPDNNRSFLVFSARNFGGNGENGSNMGTLPPRGFAGARLFGCGYAAPGYPCAFIRG
jgi:hypothetical protein